MAGTLGQQIAQQNAQQQQGRGLSRTQRTILKEQDAQARRDFEALQKKAQQLQSTEFANLSFEEYTEKYNKLSPDLQQFFASPESIIAERNARIVVEKSTFQKRIEQIQARVQQAKERLQRHIDSRNNYSSEYWNRTSTRTVNGKQVTYYYNRENYENTLREYERDVEEYEDTIRNAQGQAGKLDQGATADNILSYAEDKANYDRRRREARSEARREFNQQVQTGSLDKDLATLGLNKQNVTYDKYVESIEKYNSNVAYLQNLQNWECLIR